MLQLPWYIPAVFIISLLATIALCYKASGNNKTFAVIILLWIALQSAIGLSGFYTNTTAMPPRLLLLIGPPLLFILLMFVTPKGRLLIDKTDLRWLTLVHTVRIPVEIVLLLLSLEKAVPVLMTFEGRNYDIISGISALLLYFFLKGNYRKSITLLLIWNVLCLGLLLNIVINAVLSVPTPFQRFAFDQPNIAVLYFPYVFLPAVIVPLVLLSHLSAIRQLLLQKNTAE